jgi:SAM-dependent methyltransferase
VEGHHASAKEHDVRVISIRDLELTIPDNVAYTREQLVEAYWALHPRYQFLKSVPAYSKLLDVGAGSGGLQFWREWGKPQRLDIEMYAVDIAKGEHFDRYAAYQICDIERDVLCLPVNTFDAIDMSHVLACTTDKPLVLRKLADALSPGGRLYMEIPTPDTRQYPPREEFLKNGIQISTLNFFDDPTHIDTLSPHELRELVCGMGLHIVEQGTIQNPFLEDQLIAYGVEQGDAEVTTYGVWSKLRWAYYVVAQNIYARKATVYSTNGSLSSKNDLVLETVSSLRDFQHSSFARDWPSRRDQESEAAMLRLATDERLTANCALCGRESRFSLPLDFTLTDVKTANWRESLLCEYCGLNNRLRFAFGVLRDICKAQAHSKIYITEQATPAYAWLKHQYPNACGSEFVSSSHEQRVALESYIRELTHSSTEILRVEDLTNLSFSDSCFEFILSFDVLEHIPDYLKAVEQCYRCLRPDGYMLLSVPFRMKNESTLVRAKVAANGTVEHLMEPEYHGDPTQSSGCLCYYHFGWDLIDAMKATGFRDVTILLGWSLENAHWGDVNLIRARK